MTLLKLYSQRRKIFLVSNLKTIQINSFPKAENRKVVSTFSTSNYQNFLFHFINFLQAMIILIEQMPTFIVASAIPVRKGEDIIFHQRASEQRLINIFNLTSFHKTTKYSPKEISAAQHFDYSL